MPPNPIAAFVPLFIAGLIIERVVDARRRSGVYRFASAISDLDTGIASQVVDAFLKLVGLGLYSLVYTRFRFVTFDATSPWPWVFGLLGIDFFYYWWHRLSHVMNLLWAVHSVHHQSEDFNLAVALRQPAFEAITIIPFHLPLALLGVPPAVYVASYAIDLFYQFWVHTELVGTLGPLELVLNTPSAHRVHHGVNPEYLDKNYGGILIIWDRLFGTYEREREPPVYGVTHPLASYNPLWANLQPFADLRARVARASGAGEKLRVLVAHPAYDPPGVVPHAPRQPLSRESFRKYDPQPAPRVARYVGLHFLVVLAASGAFMSFADRVSMDRLVLPGVLILASAAALGGWCEGRSWARPVDLVRQLGAVAIMFYYLGPWAGWARAAAISAAALTLLVVVYTLLGPEPRASATLLDPDQRR